MQNLAQVTITLKFAAGQQWSQRDWKRQLDGAGRDLVGEGKVSRATTHVVFPGDPDPEMASMFTIVLVTRTNGSVDDALRCFRRLPGVQYAQIAAPRREVGNRRPFGKSLARPA